MQTDPNLTLQIKLTDHVSIREIELETESKAPNASLLTVIEITPFSEEVQPGVHDQFIKHQLKAFGLYDLFLAKQPSDNTDIHVRGLFSLLLIPPVILIETNDFKIFLNDLPNHTVPVDLVREQQNDEIIREIIFSKNRRNPDGSHNLPTA